MRIFLAILLATQQVFALTTNNKVAAFNRTEGAVVYENYALNQSFDKNLVGVSTPTGGTASIVTTSGVKLFGKGSLQFAVTSVGQLTAIRSKPFPIGLNGQTCQTKFTYATPYGGAVTQSEFSYFVTNSSGTKISATATLPATFDIAGTQKSKTAVVFYPCPYNSVTPANSWVELTIEHIGSASTSIIIDEKFDMVANDIGSGVPNNVFSAKVSSAGVVSDENEDFINGNCSVVSGTQTCPFNTGKFLIAPNCTYSINASGVSGLASNATTSTTSLAFTSFGSSTGTQTAASFNIVCTRAGTDFIQPAITPNQWNYGPRPYTPTFTGFGTPTNVDCTEARQGVYNIIDCRFTTGTATATEARVSLPGNNTSVTWSSGLPKIAGWSGEAFASTTYFAMAPLIESGAQYLTFGIQSSSANLLTKQTGSALGSSVNIHFVARVQISGWTENQNAPQLLGSVTSDASNAMKLEGAYVTAAGAVTEIGGSDWITQTSITPSSSTYTITFTKPYSSAPGCKATPSQTASGVISSFGVSQVTDITTTGAIVRTFNTSFLAANMPFYFECLGPR